MIIFWLLYYLLSFLIAFLLTKFFEKRLLKITIFSVVISLLGSIWFISPGSSQLAPVVSIFFLASKIYFFTFIKYCFSCLYRKFFTKLIKT